MRRTTGMPRDSAARTSGLLSRMAEEMATSSARGEVGGIMADGDWHSLCPEPGHHGTLSQVRPGHPVSHRPEHRGDGAHARRRPRRLCGSPGASRGRRSSWGHILTAGLRPKCAPLRPDPPPRRLHRAATARWRLPPSSPSRSGSPSSSSTQAREPGGLEFGVAHDDRPADRREPAGVGGLVVAGRRPAVAPAAQGPLPRPARRRWWRRLGPPPGRRLRTRPPCSPRRRPGRRAARRRDAGRPAGSGRRSRVAPRCGEREDRPGPATVRQLQPPPH